MFSKAKAKAKAAAPEPEEEEEVYDPSMCIVEMETGETTELNEEELNQEPQDTTSALLDDIRQSRKPKLMKRTRKPAKGMTPEEALSGLI